MYVCMYYLGTSSDLLKAHVHNTPVSVSKTSKSIKNLLNLDTKTTPSSSVDKSIIAKQTRGKKQKNEIYVDIYERINITFNSNGYVLNSSIDGSIQMKSFLSGNPPLKLALNEDLIVGRQNATEGAGNITLISPQDNPNNSLYI